MLSKELVLFKQVKGLLSERIKTKSGFLRLCSCTKVFAENRTHDKLTRALLRDERLQAKTGVGTLFEPRAKNVLNFQKAGQYLKKRLAKIAKFFFQVQNKD